MNEIRIQPEPEPIDPKNISRGGPVERVAFKDKIGVSISRGRPINEQSLVKGTWQTEIWSRRKSGTLYLKEKDIHSNLITTVGKNYLWDAAFNEATQTATNSWFGGLINAAAFSAISAGDTMASHTGWAEWTSYSQGTRVDLGQNAAASGSMTVATPLVFDITAGGTIQGLFVTTVSTKGGTTGTLFSASQFSSPPTVVNGDQVRSAYTLS